MGTEQQLKEIKLELQNINSRLSELIRIFAEFYNLKVKEESKK